MDDLISRKALLNVVGKIPQSWEYGQAISDVYEIIKSAPTLTLDDLRPKGRWVEKEESLGWGDVGVAECSVCEENWVLGEWSFEEFAEWHKFCPSCGADMRGGGEDG